MADTPETQTQNQDQAQVQPVPASEPIPAQPVAVTPEAQPAGEPVAAPVPDSNIQSQTTQTNDTNTTYEKQKRPVWLMASLGFITILCGIVTICAPSIFWNFMDIILGIFLVLSGISWVINAFKNEQKYVGCLIFLGVMAVILGFLLMFSGFEFIGTLTIWAFALWALLRGCILIYYGLTNKEQNKFWRGIMGLGILLIILFFVIAFSNIRDARNFVGICIGISTLFDGLSLLILSFRINNDPSLQDKMLEQANQNEIAQGSIDTNNTINPVAGETQQPTTVQQPTGEVQPGAIQQPIAAQPIPVAVPTPEIQQPTEAQPQETVQAPTEENKPVEEAQAPAAEPAPEVQQPTEAQPEEAVQAPTEENKSEDKPSA